MEVEEVIELYQARPDYEPPKMDDCPMVFDKLPTVFKVAQGIYNEMKDRGQLGWQKGEDTGRKNRKIISLDFWYFFERMRSLWNNHYVQKSRSTSFICARTWVKLVAANFIYYIAQADIAQSA